jgi:uncharacterized membrane protein
MVIQRWQTVWLVVAAVMMCVFCFVPMAIVPGAPDDPNSATFLSPVDMPVFLIVSGLAAVLLLLAVFFYKNTSRQKTITLVSMLLIAAVLIAEAIVFFSWDGGRPQWLGSVFLLIGAMVFALMAYLGIRRDERLLKAADRLR